MYVWVVYSDYESQWYGFGHNVGSAEDRQIEAVFYHEDDALQFVEQRRKSPSSITQGGNYHYYYESHEIRGEPEAVKKEARGE